MNFELFSTCPASTSVPRATYSDRVAEIARWSEQAGCQGILVYSDNSLVDPWLLSHIILRNTTKLCPLVAVQPIYMHPYWVAKQIASFAYLYGRRFYLNMVAGGFKNDLEALNDRTPHDERYERLGEYTAIIQQLLRSDGPVSFEGRYYQVKNLRLTPALPPALTPGVLLSGSSEAGMAAALRLGATPVEYPKPPAECTVTAAANGKARGLRVGIIARASEDDAWSVAEERFPVDRKGQLTHQLAMKVSDSSWHQQLSRRDAGQGGTRDPYWLVPFQNYKTFCPYLVGSYPRVAELLATYVHAGYRTFVLDVPASAEELEHIGEVIGRATHRLAA